MAAGATYSTSAEPSEPYKVDSICATCSTLDNSAATATAARRSPTLCELLDPMPRLNRSCMETKSQSVSGIRGAGLTNDTRIHGSPCETLVTCGNAETAAGAIDQPLSAIMAGIGGERGGVRKCGSRKSPPPFAPNPTNGPRASEPRGMSETQHPVPRKGLRTLDVAEETSSLAGLPHGAKNCAGAKTGPVMKSASGPEGGVR